MFRLFRKLRLSLLPENRFTRYLLYAVGEIILVVIGILIAVRINNANTQRNIRAEEDRILTQLNREFTTNLALLDSAYARNQHTLKYLGKIIDLMPIDPSSVNLDTLTAYIDQTYAYHTYDPVQGTMNELENISFQVIQNEELRYLLLSWHTVYEDFKEEQDFAVDFARDHYNPELHKHISVDYGLRKSGTDLSYLQSIEFENLVRVRQIHHQNNVASQDFERLRETVVRIVELTS